MLKKILSIAVLSILSLSAATAFAGQQISWSTQANSMRGQNGLRVDYYCPPGSPAGRLWGTDLYTDDSSICTAAVHAGRIRPETGGAFTIEIRPGAGSYRGSSRYGVTSSSYGGWHGSFRFVSSSTRQGGGHQFEQPPTQYAPPQGGYNHGGGGHHGRMGQQINWSTQANPLRGRNGQRVTYYCPAGGSYSGRLWGSGVYTDDSSICLAGVHAGVIRPESGGNVTIEIRPGSGSYQGSSMHGVTSSSYGGWHGSFVVIR